MTQPAGWYPDPSGTGQQRYWDGGQWTENYADAAGQPTAPGTAAPAKGRDQTLVILGYVLGVLFPIVGVIFGIILLVRRNMQGAWVIVVSVLAAILWYALAYS